MLHPLTPTASILLTPWHLGLLRLIEAADLDILPVGTDWVISDPEQPSETALIAHGPTLADAIVAAVPVALDDCYLARRDVEALDALQGSRVLS